MKSVTAILILDRVESSVKTLKGVSEVSVASSAVTEMNPAMAGLVKKRA